MTALKDGWMMLSEFVRKHGENVNLRENDGNALRGINQDAFSDEMKSNLTPTSPRPSWAVNEAYALGYFQKRMRKKR